MSLRVAIYPIIDLPEGRVSDLAHVLLVRLKSMVCLVVIDVSLEVGSPNFAYFVHLRLASGAMPLRLSLSYTRSARSSADENAGE